ncbi:hypothetical protein VE01_02548 [Pseudogymnoascus verrucosus]|uniref:Uncharacterized protein n=1 Tax=Pseudogymnoascus verrucosus TaxID=342668 RepID=A0A1B8GU70_9PEZI|nr:uncharacterized protein VE01_02548 [Pseudogymnoascus verrucosus]OBT99377.1 hypothetical protein VE01_02548 [Pseudogymnoascus verrucosus]
MSFASAPCALLALFFFAKATNAVAVPVGEVNSTAVSATSTGLPSTITQAPNLPISDQVVPINTCSYYNSTISQYQWNDPWCSIQAGTVQLTYWPTDTNYSYPATIYDSQLDYTFTSPSVYMVVNTIYGWNPCGPLGPTTSNGIFGFDLTDVSTLVPYDDMTATTRRATRQLYLSDLGKNCPTTENSEAMTNTHPVKNADSRCNPNLVIPKAIKQMGLPYWNHCGNVGNKFGLFDPPYAMPTLDGLFPVTTTAPVVPPVVPTTSAATGPTAVPDLPTNTVAVPEPTAPTPDVPVVNKPTPDVPVVNQPTPDTPVVNQPNPDTPVVNQPNPDTPVVSVPAEVSSAAGAAPTLPQQVVSLGPGGFEVIHSEGAVPSTYLVPAIGATEVGVGVAPASVVVYQGQTVTAGGAAVTVTNPAAEVNAGGNAAGTEAATEADNATSTSPVYSGSANKVLGSTVCLGAGFLVAVLML